MLNFIATWKFTRRLLRRFHLVIIWEAQVCDLISVGGQKQSTKVRAKQPKASKKVKFISEYQWLDFTTHKLYVRSFFLFWQVPQQLLPRQFLTSHAHLSLTIKTFQTCFPINYSYVHQRILLTAAWCQTMGKFTSSTYSVAWLDFLTRLLSVGVKAFYTQSLKASKVHMTMTHKATPIVQ